MLGQLKKVKNHTWILLSLLVGAIAGIFVNLSLEGNAAGQKAMKDFVGVYIDPLGQIFLALIFMIVVPLLLSALILGVQELGGVAKFGKIGGLTLLMTVVFSSLAVGLAFAAVTIVKPGSGISKQAADQLYEKYQADGAKKMDAAKAAPPADPPVLGIIPKNPLLEATRALSGGILPFMVFALFFGLAMTRIDIEKALPLKQFFEGLFEVSQKVIDMAMAFAPIGVFALVFSTASTLGIELIMILLRYALVVLASLAIHQFITYSVLLKFIAKRNPIEFFKQMKNVMITAFATSSSNATLPVALRDATDEVGLPRDISSFVLTVGATANQNGTALFEGITLVFLCQIFGIPLEAPQILTILGMSIVAGIGTAGVPGGSWPVIGSIAQGLGVNASAIGIILGIDRILDMSRTVLNVTGDMAIACCVATLDGRSVVIPEEARE